MQKARRQTARRRSSDRLSAHGFRIYFTRHLACFSPFPHGTRALSVIEEYLGLEGGPPRFAQNSTWSALLGIPLGAVHVRLPGCHRLWRAVPRSEERRVGEEGSGRRDGHHEKYARVM